MPIPCISKSKKFTTYVICRLQKKKVANYQTSDTLQFEICRPIDFVKLWWQGPQPLKIYTLRDNSSKSLVSRLQAYPKSFSCNNINSKSSGGEVASISKQALVEPYESKSHKSFLKNRWWRGGGPIQTDSL